MRTKRTLQIAAVTGTTVVVLGGAGMMITHAQGLSPSASAKVQYQAQLERQRARAAAKPAAPKLADTGTRAVSSPAPRQSGIFSTRQGIFSPTVFVVRNEWFGPSKGDIWVMAYAGGKRISPGGADTSTIPALRIYEDRPNGKGGFDDVLIGVYVAPGMTTVDAALRITEVQGQVLSVKTDSGKVLYFDMIARQFG